MQDVHVMRINVEEGKHAFRVNGVTFAKRHLVATMTKHNGDFHKTLARYLTIVPFLATAYEVKEDAPESIRYGWIKAKRLYKALELNEENTLPFMLFAMEQAGEDIASLAKQVREAGFYEAGSKTGPFWQGKRDRNDNSFPKKPTLH